MQLSFGTKSTTSRTIYKKLNPKWDQMLVLENVPIYGGRQQIADNPPDILLEIFDRDPVVSIGETMITCALREALWYIESRELDRRPRGPKPRVTFYLIRSNIDKNRLAFYLISIHLKIKHGHIHLDNQNPVFLCSIFHLLF